MSVEGWERGKNVYKKVYNTGQGMVISKSYHDHIVNSFQYVPDPLYLLARLFVFDRELSQGSGHPPTENLVLQVRP